MHFGKTLAVAFDVDLSDENGNPVTDKDNEVIFVKIGTAVSRSDFGMTSMESMVSDTVNLGITIEAEKHGQLSEKRLLSLASFAASGTK